VTSVLPDPPRTPKAAATRERLLELAARLFVERGYDAVSLRDIAVEAGVTKGAIYGHFTSKGQLLVEVIRTQLEERDRQLDPATATEDPSALFGLFIHPASRELRLLQVDAAAAARHDPDVADGMHEVHTGRTGRIRHSLAEVADPETLTFVVNVLSAGVGTQEALGQEVADPDGWKRTVAAMFSAVARKDR
jgi:AcrR family transcriptional regulator